jgi:hypothetical protein
LFFVDGGRVVEDRSVDVFDRPESAAARAYLEGETL